jgi:hypothetical protein
MNGTTSFIARGAEIAVNKGIFTYCSRKFRRTDGITLQLLRIMQKFYHRFGRFFRILPHSPFGPNSAGVIKPDASARGTTATSVTIIIHHFS